LSLGFGEAKMAFRLPEEDWQDRWLELSNDARMWAHRASELLLAGDVLHGPKKPDTERGRGERKFQIARDRSVLVPMMMLYGMSLESLMKGVAVQNGHRFAVGKGGGLKYQALFPNDATCHDLIAISGHQRIAIVLSPERRKLSERLSPYIAWGARYPAAKKWNAQNAGLKPSGRGEFELDMSWDFSTDHKTVHEFADSLFERLKVARDSDGLVELPDGWP
jgi:hypothetical protein